MSQSLAFADEQSRRIEQSARLVAHWIATTAPDAIGAAPSTSEVSSTMTILDMVHDCVKVNLRSAAILRGDASLPEERPVPVDGADAARQITESAGELAAAVRSLDEEGLTREYVTPFGQAAGHSLASVPADHMLYHGGQINYVQRLFGDVEFHFPENAAV